MSVFQAFVLGLVQGLGEFLPISSSAHLILVPWLFHWQDPGLAFDVALHLGTLLAVICFFWQDWLILLQQGLGRRNSHEGHMFWFLVAATIPGGIIGYVFEKYAEEQLRNPRLIGVMLIIMGIILYLADKLVAKRKRIWDMNFKDAMWIGISQAFAIIPGVSRSGVTMTAGRMRGLTREATARFSFLLSTPIILGAGIKEIHKINPAEINTAFVVGILTSAVVGFIAIKFLLKYLTEKSFSLFVWYRFIVGALVILITFVR